MICFNKKEDDIKCPRTRFRDNLVKQLETWKEEENEIIVCLDANENIYDKGIGKALTSINRLLDMSEVVGDHTGK